MGALADFLVPKLKRKVQQLAMVLFVGTLVGLSPDPRGVIGFLLFFSVYLSTYVYNDLLDLKDDKRRTLYREKILARGLASEKQFLAILAFLPPAAVLLTALWDPLLALFATGALLLNNVRTHVKHTVARQVLLALVELGNFEALWAAFFNAPIPFLVFPLFLAYSAMYATAHTIYRLQRRGDLRAIMRTAQMRVLTVLTALSILFALPVLSLSLFHLLTLVFGSLLYALPLYRLARSGFRENLPSIFRVHETLMLSLAFLLILAALLYASGVAPHVSLSLSPMAEMNGMLRKAAEVLDPLQLELVKRVPPGLKSIAW